MYTYAARQNMRPEGLGVRLEKCRSSTKKATKVIGIVDNIVGTYRGKKQRIPAFKVTIAPYNFLLKQFRPFFC